MGGPGQRQSWGQIWAHELLWGSWLLVCTCTSVGIRLEYVLSSEASDGNLGPGCAGAWLQGPAAGALV